MNAPSGRVQFVKEASPQLSWEWRPSVMIKRPLPDLHATKDLANDEEGLEAIA